MPRTLIIGDVHGCYTELLELLKLANATFENDRIVFLGDLVHKGPESAEVLNFIFGKNCEVILGNHDDFFLNSLLGKSKPYKEFEDILPKLKMKKKDLIDWYLDCPLTIETENWLAIHAGIDPKGIVLNHANKEILLNLRLWNTKKNKPVKSNGHEALKPEWVPWYECLDQKFYQNKSIFYGHWAKVEVQIHGNGKIIGLDTGCCYGGKLSGYIIEENKLVQVVSKQPKQFNY